MSMGGQLQMNKMWSQRGSIDPDALKPKGMDRLVISPKAKVKRVIEVFVFLAVLYAS